MPLDSTYAGRTFPPGPPYDVGREKIREFADAIGDPAPAYRDPDAARALGHPDVIAPPTFATVLTLRVVERLAEDPGLGLDYSRVVHGEERYVYSRPLRAGDVVTTTTTIETLRSAGGNDLMTTRADIASVAGEHVLTAHSTLVVRGETP